MNTQYTFPFLSQIASNWWTFLLRGLVAILFGILTFVTPGWLVYLFGSFILFDGIFALVAAMFGYGKHNRLTPTWWLVIMGICGVLGGMLAWRYPIMTAEMLVVFIGSWSIVSGIFALFGSFDIPSGAQGKGMLILNAMCSLLFGILVFTWPGAGAISIAWVISFYAIFAGVSLCLFAFKVRNAPQDAGKALNEIDRKLRNS